MVITRFFIKHKLATRECLVSVNCYLTCLHVVCDLISSDPHASYLSLRSILDITSPTSHCTKMFLRIFELTSSSHSPNTSFQGTQTVQWHDLASHPYRWSWRLSAQGIFLCRNLPTTKATLLLFSSSCSLHNLQRNWPSKLSWLSSFVVFQSHKNDQESGTVAVDVGSRGPSYSSVMLNP